MPFLNKYINEKQILSGDIGFLDDLKDILNEADMIPKYEASLVFHFKDMSKAHLMNMLQEESCKEWFHKIDREIPSLPYFLSTGKKGNNTLNLYVMGVVDFNIGGNSIHFNPVELDRFVKDKKIKIKNLCCSCDVSPGPSIKRILEVLGAVPRDSAGDDKLCPDESLEKKPQKVSEGEKSGEKKNVPESDSGGKKLRLIDLWDKYDSITLLKNDGIVHVYLVFTDILRKIKPPRKVSMVIDKNKDSSFFICPVTVNGNTKKIKAILCSDVNAACESVSEHSGVKLHFIYRDSPGSYNVLTKLETVFPTEILMRKGEGSNFDMETVVSESFDSTKPVVEEEIDELEKKRKELSEKNKELEELRHRYDLLSHQYEELKALVASESNEEKGSFIGRFFRKFFK